MGDEHHERRRETRIPIKVEASVESDGESHAVAHATSVNMTTTGVLLRFDEPISLAVGDHVSCDFNVSHEPKVPLPYWGLGRIVRVDAGNIAVELQATGFIPLDPASPAAPLPAPDAT